MRIPLFALVGLLCAFQAAAQEMIVPLNSRSELYMLDKKRGDFRKSATPPDTMELPFFDDFSEYFNKKFDDYYWPDTLRWMDRYVFVNDNLPKDPMSIGVVTLDGVDELGQPYNWLAGNTGVLCDELTSVPLNLEGKDSVILSFYYQAGGNSTYAPEEEDELILEFLDEDSTWNEVWSTPGLDDDTSFFLAMVPIDSLYYLYKGFQFRFMNYATQHTNGDFWHIDYVQLDEDRTMEDTVTNDVAFLQRTNSLLRDYTSIPWRHYKEYPEPDSLMFKHNYFRVRNGHNDVQQLTYKFEARDFSGGVAFETDTGGTLPNIVPQWVCGNRFQNCNPTDPADIIPNAFDGKFEEAGQMSEDSTYFTVNSMFWVTEDDTIRKVNDTIVYIQEFYNYYAYDDGTAEVAFGLGNLDQPGEVVIKYDVKMTDSLQAVQIYFDPVKWNLTNEGFQIVIYEGDSIPEDLIYESDTIFPQYTIQNVFYHYLIDTPLSWAGGDAMFIGWRQFASEDLTFTLGFDLQNDNSHNRYYNLGNDWIQSSIPGSVMLRPVFGDAYIYDPTSVEDAEQIDLRPYPNPVENTLYLGIDPGKVNAYADVLDLTGRPVFQGVSGSSVDVSSLIPGMYVLRLRDVNGSIFAHSRFIKR